MKYWLIRIGSLLAAALPRSVSQIVAIILGHAAYILLRQRGRRLLANIERICPERTRDHRRLVRRTWVNFALDTLDFLAIPSMRRDQILRMVTSEGTMELDRALALGKGIVFFTSHLGNWELACCYFSALGYQVHVVAESGGPGEQNFQLYQRYRQHLGTHIIPLEAQGVVFDLIQVLRRNQILVLVADRDLTGSGIPVQFMGSTARIPAGPAILSIRTGAPVMTGFFVRNHGSGRPYLCCIDPPLEVDRSGGPDQAVSCLTQAITDSIADKIRKFPDQWYVFQSPW